MPSEMITLQLGQCGNQSELNLLSRKTKKPKTRNGVLGAANNVFIFNFRKIHSWL